MNNLEPAIFMGDRILYVESGIVAGYICRVPPLQQQRHTSRVLLLFSCFPVIVLWLIHAFLHVIFVLSVGVYVQSRPQEALPQHHPT